MSDRRKITVEEVDRLLRPGEHVHSFRQGGTCFIGADWPRAKILKAAKKFGAEVAGPGARGMGHGIALIDDTGLVVFEHDKAALDAFDPVEVATTP